MSDHPATVGSLIAKCQATSFQTHDPPSTPSIERAVLVFLTLLVLYRWPQLSPIEQTCPSCSYLPRPGVPGPTSPAPRDSQVFDCTCILQLHWEAGESGIFTEPLSPYEGQACWGYTTPQLVPLLAAGAPANGGYTRW